MPCIGSMPRRSCRCTGCRTIWRFARRLAMSLFSLAGKTAVITGSTRGIGKAIAERMAEAGANVVTSSRKPEACAAVAAAIGARHGAGRAIAIPANISSKEELKHVVDETMRQFGQIDVLVC